MGARFAGVGPGGRGRSGERCRRAEGCRPASGSAVDLGHHVLDPGVVLEAVHRQVLAVAGVLEAAVRHLGDERDVAVDPDAAEVERAWSPASRDRRPWSRRWRPGRTRRRWPSATASSSSVNRCTVITGPKISSWIASSSCRSPDTHGRLEEVAVAELASSRSPPAGDRGVVGQPVEEAGAPAPAGRGCSPGRAAASSSSGRPTLAESAACSASAATKSSWMRGRGQHASRRGAVLAGVEVAGDRDALGGGLEVGVVEHDDRRLAAELEVHPLEVAAGALRPPACRPAPSR